MLSTDCMGTAEEQEAGSQHCPAAPFAPGILDLPPVLPKRKLRSDGTVKELSLT